MPEILTESFCERCGTRYTFEASPSAHDRFTRVRTLSKGFRNYVLSDETTFGEAMASARSDEVRRTSGEQLDAFHKTFNFCMNCRQYTCANCWNEVEGRCLTCAPHLGRDMLQAPFPILDALSPSTPELAASLSNGNGHANGVAPTLDAAAWPTMDLDPVEADAAATANGHDGPISAMARLDALLDPDATQPSEAPAAGLEAVADVAPIAAVEADTESGLLEAQVAQAEAQVAQADADGAQAEAQGDIATAPESHAEVEAEVATAGAPITESAEVPAATDASDMDVPVADVDARAASAAAQTSSLLDRFRVIGDGMRASRSASEADEPPEPASPAIPAPAPRADDRVQTPVWQIVAPDMPSPGAIAASDAAHSAPQWPGAAQTAADPQWPATPTWPSRPQPNVSAADAVWAASSRDLLNRPETGVQACVSCGLALSATARFCRRCGSNQKSV